MPGAEGEREREYMNAHDLKRSERKKRARIVRSRSNKDERGLFSQLTELVNEKRFAPEQCPFAMCASNSLPMPFSPVMLPGAHKPE